jgi:hypothetical protein
VLLSFGLDTKSQSLLRADTVQCTVMGFATSVTFDTLTDTFGSSTQRVHATFRQTLGRWITMSHLRHGRACPGHPRLSCSLKQRRGCPAQGRA